MHRKTIAFALAALSLAFSGCVPSGSGSPSSEAPPPAEGTSILSLNPDPIQFASTPPTVPVERKVRIENVSTTTRITVHRVALVGDPAGVFTIEPVELPFAIGPLDSIELIAHYTPTAIGTDRATVEIGTDLEGTRVVSIKGTCVSAGLIASPATVDLGGTSAGRTTRATVTLKNISFGNRVVSSIVLIDSASRQFGVDLPPMPLTIPAGSEATFEVTFTPYAVGLIDGVLEVASDDSDRPTFRLDLVGQGTQDPPGANEFLVNRTRLLDQKQPQVAALTAPDSRGAVAVIAYQDWSDNGTPGESGHQHTCTSALDANGVAVGNAPHPKMSHHTESIGYCGIAADPATGKYYLPGRWHPYFDDPDATRHPRALYMHTVKSSGGDDGARILISTTRTASAQDVRQLDIAVDSAGAARLIVFRVTGAATGPDALPQGLVGRLVNRTGNQWLTSLFDISSAPDPTKQRAPRVAFDGTRYLVVWQNTASGIWGRFFNRSGAPQGGDFPISAPTTAAGEPRVAANESTGTFLVVWQQGELQGRIVESETPANPVVTLNSIVAGTQEKPVVAVEPASGTWMVVWTGVDAAGRGIFARKFDAGLNPAGPEEQVNEVIDGDQTDPAVVWVPVSGKWLVVWSGLDTDGAGVKGRLLP